MIQSYALTLTRMDGMLVSESWGYAMYSALLSHLSPKEGSLIHQNSGVAQHLVPVSAGGVWHVRLLSEQAVAILAPLLERLQEITVSSGKITLKIKEIKKQAIDAHACTDGDNYQAWRLHFVTPSSFKSKGQYAIFPTPELILQSLDLRWKRYFDIVGTVDIRSIAQHTKITDYRLHTNYYPIKGVELPAFKGSITLRTNSSALVDFCTLMRFAPYSGVGIKTALGMGGVKCEPLVNIKSLQRSHH